VAPTLNALEWTTFPSHRQAPVLSPAPSPGSHGFTSLPPDTTGITFTNVLDGERSLTNQIFLNGSGVALGDVDGDELPDLYLCALDSPNALYRNLGNWRFQDITAASGTACADQASTGATFADVDGDRDLDLLVNGIARGSRLFLNDGKGRFSEATDAWGLRSNAGATSFALADVDGDGSLDLYVVHYRNDTMRDLPGINFTVGTTNAIRRLLTVNGQPATAPEWLGRFTLEPGGGILENGEADAFFRNSGQRRFIPQPWSTSPAFLDDHEKPVPTPYDWGLSAQFRDLNGDGAPDLYVCNDFQSPDRIWINDGQGRFHPIHGNAIRQTSLFSMGVDVADIDRDGVADIFVADMLSLDHRLRQVQVMDANAYAQIRQSAGRRPQSSRNTLFVGRGDGTYAEMAQMAGIDASDWSWCPVFLDVDLDGFEDLLITTGHWRDAQHADVARELDTEAQTRRLSPREQLRSRRRFPRLDTPNVAFRNRGDRTFSEVGAAWGFDSRRISQGFALADLDHDGDLDAVINCLNDAPLILRNNAAAPRIAVRLRGTAPNTQGIGALVRVLAAELPEQSQEMILGGRYLSSDDSVRSFAAGHATNRLVIQVRWRDGSRTVLTNAPANHRFEVVQESPPSPDSSPDRRTTPALEPSLATTPAFEDISHLLGHEHVDNPADDFAVQPLLPHRLGHAGPGVAWFDFNGDGWEDLLVGAGQGGRLAVFRNNQQGGFIPQRARLLEATAEYDQLGVLGWRESATNLVLFLAYDGSSSAPDGVPPLRRISLITGTTDDTLLPPHGSAGPIAMADLDADGDLDLFVGGRSLPGRFPEAAPSAILRNDDGRFVAIPEAARAMAQVGMVQGAVFADLDLDGRPELILASEWGPLRVLRFQPVPGAEWDPPLRWPRPGRADEPERPRQLSAMTGWWTSITAGDFDGDGRMDLMAGNWGRNTARERYRGRPLTLHFGSPEDAPPFRLLETQFDPRLGREVPLRDRNALGMAFPAIPNRFPTFAAFAAAPLDQIQESAGPLPHVRTAATLDSMVLLQRDGYFEAHPLPWPAQIAPVFGIAVGDLDGDGHEDAFLAQNFFAMQAPESRLDSGTGVWLQGDGRGGFNPVTAAEAGIRIYGEGRGAALADFDHDGRVDLVVGQNRGLTALFRNVRAQPGVTIRLSGPPRNPHAIGAVLRREGPEGRLGPAREVRSGAGYLSQDAPTQILSGAGSASAIHVRWPGGRTERVPIQQGTKQIDLRFPTP